MRPLRNQKATSSKGRAQALKQQNCKSAIAPSLGTKGLPHWHMASERTSKIKLTQDNAKVEELTDKLDAANLKVKSDSQPDDLGLASTDHTLENTLASKGQTPPSK